MCGNIPQFVQHERIEKYQFAQILVEQRKIEVLLKKPCHFSEKNSQKSGKSS
jgi:hypothetical protein